MSHHIDYSLTFACLNQRSYTQLFVKSLIDTGVDLNRVVAVDNGSTDDTFDWLQAQGIQTLQNKKNLGCGVAWNQGIWHHQSEWTIVMNNDVICGSDWLDQLLSQAISQKLQIASPAMIEGVLDYDFQTKSRAWGQSMTGYVRHGTAHAVCMLIHQSVWDQIGYFAPFTRLLGYEDAIFFQRAREANLTMGIVGGSWLHHFGMTTQKAMKLEMHLNQSDSLGDRRLLKEHLRMSWLDRKLSRYQIKKLTHDARLYELKHHQNTIHGINDSDPSEIRWI
ncbi:MAG: glycosyltransferase [Alphaproteobacteria bacterium]|nr:glycosyltransferase [Alphaproteobacteria bacterium]